MTARAPDNRKKTLDPTIIRVGDEVQILAPTPVVRVGYPKVVGDYYVEVEQGIGHRIDEFLGLTRPWRGAWSAATEPRARRDVIHQLAYARAKLDGFGGPIRSLHLEDAPAYANKKFTVVGVRSVQTGRYFPPSGGSYEDYDGGGLAERVTYRLVEICDGKLRQVGRRGPEFRTTDVRKC